jgi:hypothetical protein
VLLPFAEIAPDVVVPGMGTVRKLRAAVAERGIAALTTEGS